MVNSLTAFLDRGLDLIGAFWIEHSQERLQVSKCRLPRQLFAPKATSMLDENPTVLRSQMTRFFHEFLKIIVGYSIDHLLSSPNFAGFSSFCISGVSMFSGVATYSPVWMRFSTFSPARCACIAFTAS